MPESQPQPQPRRLLSILAALALATLLPGCGGSSSDDAPRHVAVIDAGSSGSRLYLYRTQPDGQFVQIETLFSTRNAPHPLAWYDGTQGAGSGPEQAGPDGVGPLLQDLKQALRDRGVDAGTTPVHALATAGVRLLPQATATQIHASVRAAIVAQGFPAGEVMTLSGQYEALYSWADVNYLLGRFHDGQATEGIVEVGGASAQVAFASNAATPSYAVVQARIAGRDHAVFTESYLGLGQNEALQALLRYTAGGPLEGVCHPAGAPSGPPGRYDFGACTQAYAQVLTRTAPALPQVRQLPGFTATKFRGVAALNFVFNDWRVAGNDLNAGLAQTLQSHCTGAQAWARVQAGYADPTPNFQVQACAQGSFAHTLLFGAQGLGLAGGQLAPVATLGGSSLNWTRGVVVLQEGARGR